MASGFDVEAYAAFNSDGSAALGPNREAPVRHYVQIGVMENRQTVSLLGLGPNAPAELTNFVPDGGWGPDSFLWWLGHASSDTGGIVRPVLRALQGPEAWRAGQHRPL